MYAIETIIDEINRDCKPVSKDTATAIETLREMFEMAEYFEVEYCDEERVLLSVENETDEELIKAVVDGLYEDIHSRIYN